MDKTIIEVNGIKLEVDLRSAKRIDEFRVGDTVKVLVKTYSNYESRLGIIAGFDNFKMLPTIIIASIKPNSYSETLQWHYINSESKDIEICQAIDVDLSYSKADVLEAFNRDIAKKELELKDLNMRKEYFLEKFGKFFLNEKV